MQDDALDKIRDKLSELMDPELVDKYGDPFDANDIRNTLPTERRAKDPDMSIEDEIHYLALDMEVLQKMLSVLTQDYMQRKTSERTLSSGLFGKDSTGGYL
jgi:hypothetical protein